jgi:hypothetical protein
LPAGSVRAAGARGPIVPASPFSHGVEDVSVTKTPSGDSRRSSGAVIRGSSVAGVVAGQLVRRVAWVVDGEGHRRGRGGCGGERRQQRPDDREAADQAAAYAPGMPSRPVTRLRTP